MDNLIVVSQRKRWLSQDRRSERFCYVLDGIGRKSSTKSCWPNALFGTELSIIGPSKRSNRSDAISFGQYEKNCVLLEQR